MLQKFLLAAFAGGAVLAAAPMVSAAPFEETVSHVPVTFTVRDLHDPERIDSTYARLHHAAKEACDTLQPGPVYRLADDQACEDQAMDEAVVDLGSPEVRERHKQETAAPQVASVDRRQR